MHLDFVCEVERSTYLQQICHYRDALLCLSIVMRRKFGTEYLLINKPKHHATVKLFYVNRSR